MATFFLSCFTVWLSDGPKRKFKMVEKSPLFVPISFVCYVGVVIDVVPSMIKVMVLFSYLLYEKYNVTVSVMQEFIISGY